MHSEATLFNTFWKTGDMEPFRRLMTSLGPTLHYFAVSIVGNPQEAEEIVSDVFIKIWMQRERLSPPDNVRFYLLTAVKNTALNYLKSQGRRAAHYAAWELEVNSRSDRSPEDILISKEDVRSIQNIVARLPPRCRQIFILVKEDGLSYNEVAQLLDISPATVNVQMTIALKKIWAALTPSCRIFHS